MGWSFRKSFGSGPFRFTLSKSGISGSVGIKGLRIGGNSKGSWISVGAAGIRYRHFVPHTTPGSSTRTVPARFVEVPQGSRGPFEVLQQQGLVDLSDSDSQALLQELKQRQQRLSLGWAQGCLAALLLTVGFAIFPFNLPLLGLLIYLRYRERQNAQLTLWYELDATAQQSWDALRRALLGLQQAQVIWHLHAKADVNDSRYHGGAGQLFDRKHGAVCEAAPDLIETNVAPVALQAGTRTLFFFPDRVLIYEGKEVGGVSYASLSVTVSQTDFIESETPPADAQVISHTWQYVNRNGTPDRRFANNRQIPICRYELLELASSTGMQQQFHLSRTGLGSAVVQALQASPRTPPALPDAGSSVLIPPTPQQPVVWPPAPALTPTRPPPVQSPNSSKAKAKPPLRWVPAGQPTKLNGRLVSGGMFYWQESDTGTDEPSAIDCSKGIADTAAPCTQDLGYWPSYSGISPTQRTAYVEWLAQGRRDADPSQRALGYVFLFIYGLERRILVEQDRDPALLEEIIALLEHYGPAHRSNSLRSYALQLLHFAGWQRGPEEYRALWPRLVMLDNGGQGDEAHRLIMAQLYQSGEPLDWTMAWRLAKADEMSRTSVVVSRAHEQFSELFRRRYEAAHPGGITLQAAKTLTLIDYRPASMALVTMKSEAKHRGTFQLRVPNVLGLRRQFKALPDIWNSCVDDLSGYSRALVSKKDGAAAALAAWSALPAELRKRQTHPLREAFFALMAEAPVERSFRLCRVSTIATLAGIAERTRLTQNQAEQVTTLLESLGCNYAPNPRLTLLPLAWSQEIAIYTRVPEDAVQEPQIPGLVRLLFLAITLAAADGTIDDNELAAFNEAVRAEIKREIDWRHLRAAEAALCRDTNVATRALAQIAGHTNPVSRRPTLKLLVQLAAADGEITLDEQKVLRRIARAFEVDEPFLESLLREAVALGEVRVATASRSTTSEGEKLPPRDRSPSSPASPTFQLDMDKVQALTAETHEVITMLSEVMAEDAPLEPIESTPSPVAAAPSWCAALDARYHPVLLHLIQHDEVTEAQFDTLAKQHHLLADDAFTSINAWSDEALGDFLLERADSVRIFRDLLPDTTS